MAVEVRIPTVLRKHTGGRRSVDASGESILEVIDYVESQHPGFKEQVIAPTGELHRFINCYLNDEDVRYLRSLDTAVSDGDVVSILPAVAGGATSVRGVAASLPDAPRRGRPA